MVNRWLTLQKAYCARGPPDVNDGFLVVDHIKEDIDIFTARVNYKFGGPVVARY
jgi:outer membrane immunogenic protein